MNKLKNSEYCRQKFVQALIFADDNESYIEILKEHFNDGDENFIFSVMCTIANYYFNNYLEDELRLKILNIINLVVEVCPLDNQIKIASIDPLREYLSSPCGQNATSFYRQQLAVRKDDTKYLNVNRVSDEQIEKLKPALFESLVFDYFIASTHTEAIDDEEFTKKYLPIFYHNEKYIESIRKIRTEINSIDDKKMINNRILIILEANRQMKTGLSFSELLFKQKNNKIFRKLQKKNIA